MKIKPAILFYTFVALYSFSSGLLMLSIPWYYAGQNQSSIFNIFYAITTGLSLVIGYFFGTLIDNYNRKYILLVCLGVLSIVLISTYFLELHHELIIIVFALTFWCYVLFYPAVYAIIKDSVIPRKYLLNVTILELVGSMVAVFSAGIGVLLLEGYESNEEIFWIQLPFQVERISMNSIFLLSGLSLLSSLAFLFFVKYKRRVKKNETEKFFATFLGGFQWIFSNVKISGILLLAYFVFIAALVERFGLLPVYIKNALQEGAEMLSLSEAYYEVAGNVISIVVVIVILFYSRPFLRMINSRSALYVVTGTLLVMSLLFFVSSFIKNNTVFLMVSFGFGLLNSLSREFRVVYMLNNVPSPYIGRTSAILNAATTLFRLCFILLFSMAFFREEENISYAYLILGFFTFTGTVFLFLLLRSKKYS
jgi:MFS family permease